MKLLVCGGLSFRRDRLIFENLYRIRTRYGMSALVHGGGSGAEAMTTKWANFLRLPCTIYEPDRERFGQDAERLRSMDMVDLEQPDMVLAFPSDAATRFTLEYVTRHPHRIIWESSQRTLIELV